MKQDILDNLLLLYNNKLESSISDETTEALKGHSSLINRYALFSYRGIDKNNILSDGNIPSEDAIDPQTAKIINTFSEIGDGSYGCVEYSWSDFLYCRYLDKISNNYMITLRRFPGPVEDNIYNTQITAKPDLARLVTWAGEETGNQLSTVLKMTYGFKWRSLQSEIQEMKSSKWNSGLVGAILGQKAQNATDLLQRTARETGASNFDKRTNQLTDSYDPRSTFGYYHNRLYGPVNVIDSMQARDRGFEYTQSITLTFEYTMKAYGKISPKEAMLDVLANILTVTYNNAPFWGGAVRYHADNRTTHILGDQQKLLKGDWVGYFGSVGADMGNMFQNIFSGSGGFDLGAGLAKLGNMITSNFFAKKINDAGVRTEFQSVKALLTGESTGEWHLTVGNPFRPIAMFGNLILKTTDIEFFDTVGIEDFPIGIKATLTLEPARPRDKTDIESAFNSGKGRLYLPPKQGSDILNIAGKEKPTVYVDNGLEGKRGGNKKHGNINNFEKPAQILANGINRFAKWSGTDVITANLWHSVNEHNSIEEDKTPTKEQ